MPYLLRGPPVLTCVLLQKRPRHLSALPGEGGHLPLHLPIMQGSLEFLFLLVLDTTSVSDPYPDSNRCLDPDQGSIEFLFSLVLVSFSVLNSFWNRRLGPDPGSESSKKN